MLLQGRVSYSKPSGHMCSGTFQVLERECGAYATYYVTPQQGSTHNQTLISLQENPWIFTLPRINMDSNSLNSVWVRSSLSISDKNNFQYPEFSCISRILDKGWWACINYSYKTQKLGPDFVPLVLTGHPSKAPDRRSSLPPGTWKHIQGSQ